MPDRAPGKTWAVLAGLAVIAIAMRAAFLGGGQLDYDEGVYWQSLRALAAGHPLFSSVYSSQPPGFLLLLAPFYNFLGQSLPAARAGVAFFSVLGIGSAYVAASRLGGRGAGLAAAALLVADPLYLRQSVTIQADGPALALALGAVAAATLSRERTGSAGLVYAAGSGLLLGTAVMVKLLALPAALPVLLLLWTGRARVGAALVAGLLMVGVLLVPFSGELNLVLRQSIGLHLGPSPGGLGGPAALWALARWEVPLVIAGILTAAFHRPRGDLLTAASWLLLAGVALFFVTPLWPHHLLALSVPLALLAAPGVASLATRASIPALALGLLAALASQAIVVSQQLPSSPAVVARVEQLVAPGEEVVTDDQFGAALAGRSTPPELVDTSFVRVRSHDLSLAQIETVARRDRVRLVILASGRLAEVPGLVEWAAASYPKAEAIGAVRLLEGP